MMAKFLLGVAVVAFTTFCGYFLSRKYRRRKSFFEQFYAFNERFLSEISYYRRPLAEFVSRHDYAGEFKSYLDAFFEDLEEEGAGRERAVISSFAFLKAEEKRALEDYFLMLGKGDSLSQKGYFSSQKQGLQALREQSIVDCKRYVDLYVKVGFLCGLLILILLL